MSNIIDTANKALDFCKRLKNELGLKYVVRLIAIVLVVLGIFNFPRIVEYVMKVSSDIEKRQHEKRLVMRDNLLEDLNPLLIEFRSSVGASRLLYFEYHNSTENFVGIPFKFANLVLANQRYDCPGYNPNRYKDINSGMISGIYSDLRKNRVIINKGLDQDSVFYYRYPGIHEFFSTQDGSTQQMFINVPGVHTPIGMIVLEWVNYKVMTDEEWDKVLSQVLYHIPRVNAMISKYTP